MVSHFYRRVFVLADFSEFKVQMGLAPSKNLKNTREDMGLVLHSIKLIVTTSCTVMTLFGLQAKRETANLTTD